MVFIASSQLSWRACQSAGGLSAMPRAIQSVVARTAGSKVLHFRASLDSPRAKAESGKLTRVNANTDRNHMTHPHSSQVDLQQRPGFAYSWALPLVGQGFRAPHASFE